MAQLLQRVEAVLEELKKRLIRSKKTVGDLRKRDADYKQGDEPPLLDESFLPFSEHDFWGEAPDSHAWFYADFTADPAGEGCCNELKITTNDSHEDASQGPQFLIYLNDECVKGGDNNHCCWPLSERRNRVFIYAYTGMAGGKKRTLTISLIEKRRYVEKLIYDLEVPFEILRLSDENSFEFARLSETVASAVGMIDLRPNSPDFPDSVVRASDFLSTRLYTGHPAETAPKVVCTGHTHIDIAWLWTVRQTREKVQRSFANALALLDEYPRFSFMSSQPLLYQFVKEESPLLYQQIRQRVEEGRWEPEGGMWLEADCNLLSGESLVRQILYGKRFFREEFGKESRILWLPDTFGFPAGLPQILKKSGIDFFVTSKINWNETNDFPFDLFSWQGMDGSRVDSYLLTAQDYSGSFQRYTTYIGLGNPSFVKGTWSRFRQKELSDCALLAYGYGDGGGGPTREFCEKLERLSFGLPGCPATEFRPLSEFFRRMKESCRNKILPVWTGELYLEFHRGTYTSMGKNKRFNRKGEYLLRDIELFCSLDAAANGVLYPAAELEKLRKILMLNQFHDILPGSSIAEVYEQSDRDYEELFDRANVLYENVLDRLAAGRKMAFNPCPISFSGDIRGEDGFVFVENIPGSGLKSVLPSSECHVVVSPHHIENRFFKITFDRSYQMTSVYDKLRQRELVPEGKVCNQLVAFEDHPGHFDAWELKEYYREKGYPVDNVSAVTFLEEGNRRGINVRRRFLDSVIEQSIWLYEHNDYIDIENRIDWRTEHIVLKALFPLDICCEKAICDTQFGNVERRICKNTSWDRAEFEVCAHKFVDYSESDYGVAIINDCKYGYGLDYKEISLTLLKCATDPNANADKAEHIFKYAIYPHSGNYAQSGVLQASIFYNDPVFFREGKELPDGRALWLVRTDRENVVIEAVKKAEDSEHLVIRLAEEKCQRTAVELTFFKELESVCECDLMENNLSPLPFEGNSLQLVFRPFEIRSVMVKFKNSMKR